MKLKQAGINISIMSELKSFPWQSNYEHDYLMVDYHLRVYQRIAPYIGIFLLKILDLENKVSDQKKKFKHNTNQRRSNLKKLALTHLNKQIPYRKTLLT